MDVGDTVPDVTTPLANGEVDTFALPDRLDEAPLVLAFFPGAFTEVCTHEMETFADRIAAFDELDAAVYGVSIDTPFALNAFREDLALPFPLVSDTNRELIHEFDVAMDFASMGVEEVAKRAVFVVDGNGEVTYRWVASDPGIEPDYDEVLAAVERLAEPA